MFTIAHRLHTIMDSDKVLVLDAGQYVPYTSMMSIIHYQQRVVEFDSPLALLQDSDSYFAKLVAETTSREQENFRETARKAAHVYSPLASHSCACRSRRLSEMESVEL